MTGDKEMTAWKVEERNQFFTRSLDLLGIGDRTGFLRHVNPAFVKATGWSEAELTSRPLLEFVHPDDRPGVMVRFQQMTAGTPAMDFDVRTQCKDGSFVSFAWTATADQESGLFYACGRDNAARRRVEEQLRQLSRAVEHSPSSVIITDAHGAIEYVNPKFTELTGYSYKEAVGKNPRILKTDHLSPEHYKRLWETILGGQEWRGEFHNRKKNGDLYWESASISSITNEQGTITHFVAVKEDISARKRAEAEVEESHQKLVAASHQAGMAEVATGVLHNVGNVLNSANVSATVAIDTLGKLKVSNLDRVVAALHEHAGDIGRFMTDDPTGRQLPDYLAKFSQYMGGIQQKVVGELQELRQNIEHIKEIVTMQQNYSRLSGGSEVLKVNELVEDSLRMNAAALKRRDIRIVRDFQEVPPINVAKHKVLQILVNLIRNANYAVDESGRPDKQLTLCIADKDGRIRISVADNGIGIAAENLPRLFKHGFTTRKDGHGYGLHSSALAAADMGGSLTAHSDGPGCGARFTLELPVSPAAPAAPYTHLIEPESMGRAPCRGGVAG